MQAVGLLALSWRLFLLNVKRATFFVCFSALRGTGRTHFHGLKGKLLVVSVPLIEKVGISALLCSTTSCNRVVGMAMLKLAPSVQPLVKVASLQHGQQA
jgi:hypothetical protein